MSLFQAIYLYIERAYLCKNILDTCMYSTFVENFISAMHYLKNSWKWRFCDLSFRTKLIVLKYVILHFWQLIHTLTCFKNAEITFRNWHSIGIFVLPGELPSTRPVRRGSLFRSTTIELIYWLHEFILFFEKQNH